MPETAAAPPAGARRVLPSLGSSGALPVTNNNQEVLGQLSALTARVTALEAQVAQLQSQPRSDPQPAQQHLVPAGQAAPPSAPAQYPGAAGPTAAPYPGPAGVAAAVGPIQLILVGARDLIAADLLGKSDPYCIVEIKELSKKFTSAVIKNTRKPEWNQLMELNAPNVLQTDLKIKIKVFLILAPCLNSLLASCLVAH